ncbi:MAG: hypothetical protein RIS90_2992 [Pseudomonadota bacterium]|jgi:HSP20 family protein
MLNSLKQTGQTVGRELSRAWDHMAEGWRELLSRSGHALTRFRHSEDDSAVPLAPGAFPRWSLLAGELEETPRHMVVRVELPGMGRDDCRVSLEGNTLRISGEKQFECESDDSTYHVMERAYGAFERVIPLPRHVDPEQAEASFKNGVLTVRLLKSGGERGRLIQVS